MDIDWCLQFSVFSLVSYVHRCPAIRLVGIQGIQHGSCLLVHVFLTSLAESAIKTASGTANRANLLRATVVSS